MDFRTNIRTLYPVDYTFYQCLRQHFCHFWDKRKFEFIVEVELTIDNVLPIEMDKYIYILLTLQVNIDLCVIYI